MKVKLMQFECIVTKEPGDPTYRNTNWSDAESTFLYHVKKELISQGHDVIKTHMWKDGHLVDDRRQCIRTRQAENPSFCVYNASWAVYDAGIEFNECGRVRLAVVRDL